MINKDTLLYGSFSNSPGNNGCVFFNELFKKHNINAIYKSFYSDNISNTITSVKHLKFSGFALSAPHKIEVLEYLNETDISVQEIGAANTIINKNDKLCGYNTDWVGVYELLRNENLEKINILGNGWFSKSIQYACKKLDLRYIIYHRNDILSIDDVANETFINATPIDIKSVNNRIIDGRPFTEEGKNIFNRQAKEQFKLYTGISYE